MQDDARRRLGISPLELLDDDLARVEELAALGGAALAAVGDLPESERAAVRARVVDERPYGEIAAELRCSQSVVRQRVSRGLARVRAQLSKGSGAT